MEVEVMGEKCRRGGSDTAQQQDMRSKKRWKSVCPYVKMRHSAGKSGDLDSLNLIMHTGSC